MKKYKFTKGDKLYAIAKKRIYLESSTKHRQKEAGVVTSRFRDGVTEKNYYVVQSEAGLKWYEESTLTKIKEKVLGHILVTDLGVYQKLEEKPEVIPEGSKLLTVMGVLDD